MMENNKKHNAFFPLVFSLVLVVGIFIGRKYFPTEGNKGFTIYPQTGKINTILNFIERNYVDEVSKKEMEETAIPIILEELDPHSIYIPAKDLQKVTEPLEGNFSGIGIQFNMQDDTVVVIQTIANGPSEKVGVLAGDRIVKVNDSIVAGVKLSSDYIVSRLKGRRGTDVRVSIKRSGVENLIDFIITRDNIPLYSVDVSYMIDDEVGYIKVNKFSLTTLKEFVQGVTKLHEQGMRRLIVDLRGNSGGYLDAATNISDQFLKQDKLIVYTEGRMSPRKNYFSTSRGVCLEDEVVILIDEWSASASEILSGAIQDNDRGLIVGRRSFGKGLVQSQKVFNDGSALRLTIARYYTPTGRSIQKPYENGSEDYFNDLQGRYERGEFLNRDSIHFADSLRYYTPKGKVVYGGGGIMPDIFIPMDTIGHTLYYERVRNSGLIYKFAFEYADKNRKVLKNLSDYRDMDTYLTNKDVLSLFVKFAEDKGLKPNYEEIEISKKILSTQLNAYIVRNILDNDGFYPILERTDKTLQRAIEIINK